MGRSQESFQKKEVRNKKEKKRKEKEAKRLARKDGDKPNSLDDMIAYVDENGMITDTPPDPDKKTEIKVEDIVIGVPKDADLEPEDAVRKGIVTFFNQSKGFGFIRDGQSGESLFVHINNITEPIVEGNSVSYEMERGPKGMMAVNVKVNR
ncbi:cold-shock protein [Mangrovibacterium diazotrophicum]|uniref:Putative cold-shock DNA-binding protein n=1 Tax=Mangrovibacterium diazotrophicum TaxID=1261403 RepID=A0A419VX94_9BACT|nr:cold shock domain-containing protein [Mangrovibacterium diazotrophicum]RKD87847.1 putative cold-shock DNA-binding protein [Mangrovibacterium diazotrophicum]